MRKRAAVRKIRGRRPARPGTPSAPARQVVAGPARWPQLLGEAVLILLVIAVPLAINPLSRALTDVKDVVLGLGVAGGLGLWLVAGLATGRLSWARSRLNVLVLVYAGWAAVSIAYSRFPYVAVSEFGRLAANVGLYLLVIASLRTTKQAVRVIGAACLASIPVSIYAFAQAAGKDFLTYKTAATGRVFSFLGNPTYLGGYLILLVPMAVALGWPGGWTNRQSGPSGPQEARSRRARRWDWESARPVLFAVVAAMMLLSLYLSYTLSAAIGLGFGMVIALALAIVRGGRKAVRVAALPVAVGVVLVVLLGLLAYRHMPKRQQARVDKVLHFQDPYAAERQLHWGTALQLFRDAPAFGEGYGNFRLVGLSRMAGEWYLQAPERRKGMLALGYAHNEYLQVLADTGLVGGILFLAMLVAVYGLALRVAFKAETALWRRFGLAVVVACTAFCFQNFFGITFRQTGSVTLFWLWLGVLAVAGASLPGRKSAAAPSEQAIGHASSRSGARAGDTHVRRGDREPRLPRPASAHVGPRLRELRFRPVSLVGLGVAVVCVGTAVVVLGWVAITPIQAGILVRRSEREAEYGLKALTAGNKQIALKQFEASAARAQEALDLCPYSSLAYYQLAFAEGQAGELQSSRDLQQAWFQKAADANRQALSLMPASGPTYYNLGVTYRRLGDLAEAERAFRKAVELSPTLLDHQAALADVLVEQGRVSEAMPYALKCVELAPDSPKAYTMLAATYQAQGNKQEAINALVIAADLAPSDAGLRGQLAQTLLASNQYQKAMPVCQQWVSLAPKSAQAHYGLGFAHYKLGNLAAACGAFEQTLRLKSDFHEARLYLAHSLRALGETERAMEEYSQVVQHAGATDVGREAKQELDNLRGEMMLRGLSRRSAPRAAGPPGR